MALTRPELSPSKIRSSRNPSEASPAKRGKKPTFSPSYWFPERRLQQLADLPVEKFRARYGTGGSLKYLLKPSLRQEREEEFRKRYQTDKQEDKFFAQVRSCFDSAQKEHNRETNRKVKERGRERNKLNRETQAVQSEAQSTIARAMLANESWSPPAKKRVRKPIQPRKIAQLADMLLEEGEFFDAFQIIAIHQTEAFADPPYIVRESAALALDPFSCVRGTSAKQTLQASSVDPVDPDAHAVSLWACLKLFNLRSDPVAMLSALPGRQSVSNDEFERDVETNQPAVKENALDQSKGKEDDEDEDDYPIETAGKRVKKAEDIWDLLGGASLPNPIFPTPDNPVTPKGWDLLRVAVEGWETDGGRGRCDGRVDYPWSPELLRQLPKPADGTRSDVTKVLDVVFAALREEADDEFLEDELNERVSTAMRLFGLLVDLAQAGRLLASRLVEAVNSRLKTMDQVNFRQFLTDFPAETTRQEFKIRLLTSYLHSFSHSDPSTGPRNVPALTLNRKLNRTSSANSSNRSLGQIAQDEYHVPSVPLFCTVLLSKVPVELYTKSAKQAHKVNAVMKHIAAKREIYLELRSMDRDFTDWTPAKLREGILKGIDEVTTSSKTRSAKPGVASTDILLKQLICTVDCCLGFEVHI